MERSESTINLDKAMLAAQKNIIGATKDSKNPFFKSNYASLAEIMETCKKPLNDAGIYITQMLDSDGTNDYLITMVVHGETSEYRSTKMKIHNTSEGIQQAMSEQSYLKRYMIQALTFMPTFEDDGEAAMGRKNDVPKVEKKSTRTEVPAASPDKGSEAPKTETVPTFSKKAVASAKEKQETKSSAFDD